MIAWLFRFSNSLSMVPKHFTTILYIEQRKFTGLLKANTLYRVVHGEAIERSQDGRLTIEIE